MRMKRAKQQEMVKLEKEDRAKLELFNFRKQLAEHWEKAGTLWARVDGKAHRAQQCFESAAHEVECACHILEEATAAREEKTNDDG